MSLSKMSSRKASSFSVASHSHHRWTALGGPLLFQMSFVQMKRRVEKLDDVFCTSLIVLSQLIFQFYLFVFHPK